MAAQNCCSRLRNLSLPRVFHQIAASRRDIYSTPLTLDFLLPITSNITNRQYLTSKLSIPFINSIRSYSVSSKREKTIAIFNPLKDEDGIDMSLEITPRASNRLKEIMSQDSNPNLALRIKVVNGGCHGFQYLMSLTTLPSKMDSAVIETKDLQDKLDDKLTSDNTDEKEKVILSDDDVVFAAADGSGAKVVTNASSLEVLKGSKVDYTMELIGSQFKIVDNPLATSSCGCGTSFDIK
ncbi:Iron-sulfur cluster insertion protein ErpA [Erysiphe neolycopersici]|uniref:Iron-sulfur cluster insertion protein ErpA n=1 Tax=Erysiphe neolycopersici TaxID=212602 RepID=A0A420I046_9PEZI|nr:Iron-sulfur cluster insertion protein ErpA [Erysiphe neolycopersici]